MSPFITSCLPQTQGRHWVWASAGPVPIIETEISRRSSCPRMPSLVKKAEECVSKCMRTMTQSPGTHIIISIIMDMESFLVTCGQMACYVIYLKKLLTEQGLKQCFTPRAIAISLLSCLPHTRHIKDKLVFFP